VVVTWEVDFDFEKNLVGGHGQASVPACKVVTVFVTSTYDLEKTAVVVVTVNDGNEVILTVGLEET
jgi:hypothetical protein